MSISWVSHRHFPLRDKANAVLAPDCYAGNPLCLHRFKRILCGNMYCRLLLYTSGVGPSRWRLCLHRVRVLRWATSVPAQVILKSPLCVVRALMAHKHLDSQYYCRDGGSIATKRVHADDKLHATGRCEEAQHRLVALQPNWHARDAGDRLANSRRA